MALPMSRLGTPPASRFGRGLSRYGWGRRTALIAAALVGSAAFAYAADVASRHALWQVVRVCMLDKATTGSPFPCLEVNLAGGRERGYIVLRPPIGRPDTILTPTRRIVGLEDPQLQAPGAPNYFALAWDERRWVAPASQRDRVALAVNSRLARSQDQLHVHMGCLAADFAARLRDGLGPSTGTWFRARDMAPGLQVWTYRTGGNDWRNLAPFRLLKQLVGDTAAMRRTTLAVAMIKGEFVVVALPSRPGGWYAAAEDILDARC
jgi:CDP-diacylglycerol pyrophosphatase